MAKPPRFSEVRDRLDGILGRADGLGVEALRTELELLARSAPAAFSGLTDRWGPPLDRRDRLAFRPFLLAHFGIYRSPSWWKYEPIPWSDDLEAWLAAVDRDDEVELFRRLWAWKHRARSRGGYYRVDEAAWRRELLGRWRAAPDRHRRMIALAKLDREAAWGAALDEEAALALYREAPDLTGPFILRFLPDRWSLYHGDGPRKLWGVLFDEARAAGDDAFAFALYRKQIPLKRWQADAVRAIGETEPGRLTAELERRHPEGWGLDLGPGLVAIIEAGGESARPYVMRHVGAIGRGIASLFGLAGGSYGALLSAAEERNWVDLWAALVRANAYRGEYDRAVSRLVAERRAPEDAVIRRLLALAGVGLEWNVGPIGLAHVPALSDATATALYDRFPALVHGPFRGNVAPLYWANEWYPALTERALSRGDDRLVDFIAARLATRTVWAPAVPVVGDRRLAEAIERLSAHYEGLRDDPAGFARRVASVLGQMPPYVLSWNYDQLIRTNRLARLLFERSAAHCLDDAWAIRELLEAPEIHVQGLAFRALARDDDRARRLAAANLDLLLPTLLRPLHRRTRLWALRALGNAAADADAARRVHDRARQALDLPDAGYPKDELIGLIGRLLHRWPELRADDERPVVYGLPAGASP